jgi:hypothetical protein
MLTIGVLQIIPAIILIAYGLVKQKRLQVYFDMLLMALPATLFYGILMRILPEGLFEWYFYFFAKVVLFLLPGLIIIRLRKYKLRDFGITKEGLKLSLLLGFGILTLTSNRFREHIQPKCLIQIHHLLRNLGDHATSTHLKMVDLPVFVKQINRSELMIKLSFL